MLSESRSSSTSVDLDPSCTVGRIVMIFILARAAVARSCLQFEFQMTLANVGSASALLRLSFDIFEKSRLHLRNIHKQI